MSMSDPIADMLTRIRNASLRKFKMVIMPYSKAKHSLADVMEKEGFITAVTVDESTMKKNLILTLKYHGPSLEPVCATIKRVSRPGLRCYAKWDAIPRNGFGITVVSTSQGMMSDHDARRIRQGGEVICKLSTVSTES